MLADTVNIVGITAYVLLGVFFWWVSNVPQIFSRTHYLFLAVVCILFGRLVLFALTGVFTPLTVSFLYGLCLTLEKLFLILGLLYFLLPSLEPKLRNRVYIFTFVSCVLLFVSAGLSNQYQSIVLAVTQSTALVWIGIILFKERNQLTTTLAIFLPPLCFLYVVHWATYPIAMHYPVWFQAGFFIGNVLNLIVYLSFAYMVLVNFQNQMFEMRRTARKLSKETKLANQAKSQFLANMSHEVRTPLNGVIGILALLRHDKLTKEQSQLVELAYKSGDLLLAIINDILDFSKIEAGKLTLVNEPIQIHSLFEEIVGLLRSQAQQQGIELLLDISDIEDIEMEFDGVRLRQVLVNLIANAIKFTPKGYVLIKAHVVGHTPCHLSVTIADTGIGIAPEHISLIFEGFEQVDGSSTRQYGGTGLGLAISNRLVQLMGGELSVASELHKGSQFKLTLEQDAWRQVDKTFCFSKSAKVLVYSQSDMVLQVLQKQLASFGMLVKTISDRDQLIAKSYDMKDAFDLVLVDLVDAVQADLIPRIKQGALCAHAALIALVHEGTPPLCGADDNVYYVVKPILPSELYEHLLQLLENRLPEQPSHIQNVIKPQWRDDYKVLLIEDNRVNQIVAKQMLELNRLDVKCADNGIEALKLLRQTGPENAFDLILTDCLMPELDGFATTEAIRTGGAGSRYLSIPIIAMTANAMAGAKEKCLAAGMNDYISKPISEDALIRCLKIWLH